MPANHIVWTIESANDFFDRVLEYVKEKKGCYTLGEAAVECGEYEEVISYLIGKYSNNDDFNFKSIKQAKDIVKARCINKGMNMETNATMTIFNLVNNFDMVNTNSKSEATLKVEEKKQIFRIGDSDIEL